MAITPPAHLTDEHDLKAFDCGNDVLNDWLKRHALNNEKNGGSRTYVITDEGRVIGYLTMATGAVDRKEVPDNIAKKMPRSIPVTVLGRLAIDNQYKGQRLGVHLLREAMIRTIFVAEKVGSWALIVHAIDEDAKNFYLKYGFIVSAIDPMTLMIPVENIKAHLAQPR